MTVMDFPASPVNGQTTTDGRYYFDSSVGSTGAWRSTPLPVGGLPAGSIMAWGTNTPPANWLLADGTAVSRSTYSSLFAVIGTQYGAGNGTSTFNLPDLRGRVPVGKNGGTFGTLGATGGAETHTLTEAQMPSHNHWIANNDASGPYTFPAYSAMTGFTSSGTSTHNTLGTLPRGDGQAHNILQPYQVVNYIIKASAGWTAGDSELATRVGALETADATTNKSGLVPVVPTSVTVGSGSATVSSNGLVTFTGASTLTLNNCFSSTYTHYRAIIKIRNVANASALENYLRFMLGSTEVNTNYYGAVNYATYTTSPYLANARSAGTEGWYAVSGSGSNATATLEFEVISGDWSAYSLLGSYPPTAGFASGQYNALTSSLPTGFKIFNSGAVAHSGTVQVYGYR